MTTDIFDAERVYDDSDTELDIIGSKHKRAQWRHRRTGPCYVKFGRRVKYLGADLNKWAEVSRVQTNMPAS